METGEHTDVGDAIQYQSQFDNPYLQVKRVGDRDVLHVSMMHDANGIPQPIDGLTMTAGEIIAMAGDYFTEPGWAQQLDIPNMYQHSSHIERGKHLIEDEIDPKETEHFVTAFDTLADKEGQAVRDKVDLIYRIDKVQYFPADSFKNIMSNAWVGTAKIMPDSIKHLMVNGMLAMRVPKYKEMLENNEAHFTPWSVRAYVIGHTLALKQAQVARELRLAAESDIFEPTLPQVKELIACLDQGEHEKLSVDGDSPRCEILRELSHRYHAMGVAMDLFVMHYFSDGFAPGHMSRMSYIRKVLPDKFGTIGSILVNSMHDEDNGIGLTVDDHYDPNDNDEDFPVPAQGDGDFHTHLNQHNRANCIRGMTFSLEDIDKVLSSADGAMIPREQFGGFRKLPDVDMNVRQPQPMFVLWNDKIYYRHPINTIKVMGPKEHKALLSGDPTLVDGYCYKQLKKKWRGALPLMLQIRALRLFRDAKVRPLSAEEEARILADERELTGDPDYYPGKERHYQETHLREWQHTRQEPVVREVQQAPEAMMVDEAMAGEEQVVSEAQALERLGMFKVSRVPLEEDVDTSLQLEDESERQPRVLSV